MRRLQGKVALVTGAGAEIDVDGGSRLCLTVPGSSREVEGRLAIAAGRIGAQA
jgi:hypothetical protein